MQDLDACDGVDTTTSPTTITATRMGRSVGLNTAAAEIARASNSKNFKSAKVVKPGLAPLPRHARVSQHMAGSG